MLTINPETSLPELPEGYFWRVTRWNPVEWSAWDLQIKIRKHMLGGLFSWGIASTLTQADARRIAEDAERLENQFHERLTRRAGRGKFLGDYPPKRLEGH